MSPALIRPVTAGDDLVAQIREDDPGYGLSLWWLGQSGFLIKAGRVCVLFDPYLSDSLTRKYAATDHPHVRMTELVVEPDELDLVDVVVCSHHHTDHLDGDTLRPLVAANPDAVIVVPESCADLAADRAGLTLDRIDTLNPGQSAELNGVTLHAVAAAHERVELDAKGHHRYLGFVAVFDNGYSVYHSGDTILHDDLVPSLAPFTIDVALLPINGRRPERGVAGNLWGREAARLAKDIGADLAVPCHYDMFTFNTETPEEFVATCEELGQPHRVLACGERCHVE
ncbi:MAG: MBL fold metallo-hydrolase [Thermoanaerobaculia bacterium]|nr:MBL fold metallo-hydrolase [Thermoanaerobaculia bacterium]